MLPLAANYRVGRGLAGFAALWFIFFKGMEAPGQRRANRFLSLLRPFALGLCVMIPLRPGGESMASSADCHRHSKQW